MSIPGEANCSVQVEETMNDEKTEREMASALGRITVDPQTCGGRPCIRGLRIRAEDILDMRESLAPSRLQ